MICDSVRVVKGLGRQWGFAEFDGRGLIWMLIDARTATQSATTHKGREKAGRPASTVGDGKDALPSLQAAVEAEGGGRGSRARAPISNGSHTLSPTGTQERKRRISVLISPPGKPQRKGAGEALPRTTLHGFSRIFY